MAKEFLGTGWKYPVGLQADGRITLSRYEEDIREAILIILGTAKGERVMRPDFGCGIHDLVFATVNVATIGQVESTVREALTEFEPRIELIEIKASRDDASNGKLNVSIDYRVRATNNEFNLVYPFYLDETSSAAI